MLPVTNVVQTSSLALIVASLISTPVHATLGLAFSANGSDNTLSIAPGDSLSIPIFLRQYSAEASQPDFVATHGLNVFGVAGSLAGGGVSIVNNSFVFGTPFTDQGALNPSTSTPASFVMNGFDPRVGSPGATGESILLGSISIHGITAGALATLTLADPDTTLDDFATSPNFGSFDAKVFANPASITIAVVPEGSTLILAAIGLTAGTFLTRRARRLIPGAA